MPSTLAGGFADDVQDRFLRAVEVGRSPVAGQRRVEHVAEPVQDDRRAGLLEDASVDQGVVVRPLATRAERAARHQDDAPAFLSMKPTCSS